MAIIWGFLLLWAIVNWEPFYNVKHMGSFLWKAIIKTQKKQVFFCASLTVADWMMEKIRTREFGFFFPFELQLLRGICGLRAMFLRQPLLMTCTGVLTSQQPQRSSPEYPPFPCLEIRHTPAFTPACTPFFQAT